MNTFFKNFILLIFSSLLLPAQEPEIPKNQPSAETQKRIDKLLDAETTILIRLTDIDIQIEKKLDTLLNHTLKSRDSVETGTLVIRNKKKIISDLQKAQASYKTQREKIDNTFSKDTDLIQNDVNNLKILMDEKINTRIKQITKVTDSLAAYKEYFDWNHQFNDRKNVETADREKNRIIADFEKEMKELNTKAEKSNKSFTYNQPKENIVKHYYEVQAINERISLLEYSIEDIRNGGADGRKVGKVEGLRLDKEVRTLTIAISVELKSFFFALNRYQQNLNQRKILLNSINKTVKPVAR